jgi:hypothetical protein
MPFPTQEKKPGLMIAVGVPKEPPRMGAPGSKREPPPPAPDDEAAEPPAEEAGEDYGARLLSDLSKPLTDLGMGDEEARSTLADIFTAAARCLRGSNSSTGFGSDSGTAETDRY